MRCLCFNVDSIYVLYILIYVRLFVSKPHKKDVVYLVVMGNVFANKFVIDLHMFLKQFFWRTLFLHRC